MAPTTATPTSSSTPTGGGNNNNDQRLDIWRNSVAFLAKDSLEVSVTVIPDESRNVTSMVASPSSPFLAIGSGTRNTNIFLVQTPKKPGTDFRIAAGFMGPGPVYSLSWSGKNIISGSSDGIVQVYQVDSEKMVSKDEAISALQCTAQLAHRLPKNQLISPPGTYYNSTRVSKVDFAPVTDRTTSQNQFATIIGTNVHLWDLNKPEAPYRSDKVSHNANLALQWHLDPNYQLLAVAGADKGVTVLDPRKSGKPIAWRARYAHYQAIRDLTWHPYIPYWLTTAGEDYTINLFDVRYDAHPVLTMPGQHGGTVHSICWSNSHSDFLATGCEDRQLRLWQLRPTKNEDGQREVIGETLLESTPLFNGSIVKTLCSYTELDVYYAVSFLGELRSYGLKDELLSMVAMHRYNEQANPLEHSIESAVYRRDLDTAFKLIQKWQKQGGNENKAQESQTFTDLITPRERFDPNSWKFPAQGSKKGGAAAPAPQPGDTFPRELAKRAWFLPPGFNPVQFGRLAAPEKEKIDLKNSLKEFIQQGKWDELRSMQNVIMDSLVDEPGLVDARLLRDILKCVLPHDPIAALRLGHDIVKLQKSNKIMLTSDLAPTVHMLLYPTIFDQDEQAARKAASTPEERAARRNERKAVIQQVEKALRKLDEICDMILLEIAIQEIVAKESDTVPRDLVKALRGKPTISAGAIKLYLKALVQLRMYEEYFSVSTELMKAHADTDFGKSLEREYVDVVVPKCKAYLEAFVVAAQEDPEQMTTQDYRDVIDMCLRILKLVNGEIPGLGRATLGNYVNDLTTGYCGVLERLIRDSKYSHVPKECIKLSKILSEALAAREDMPEDLKKALDKLQKYARI